MLEKLVKRFSPKKEHKDIPFTIFSGFWLSYLLARLFIYFFPSLFTNLNGVHIHHFSYGIILLSILGFYSLTFNPRGDKLYKTSFLFGVALALTYDEFGMWLHLTDDGVARWGYDAVAIISVGFINFLYLDQHWKKLIKTFKKLSATIAE
jgi:glucan phosphoethanolaminetransferase (alkaline phosphatase superfamily)